jgi:hypothetical protein
MEQSALSYWDWFDESVDYLADGTGCVRSREGPRLVRGHLEVIQKACRPSQIRCRIHRFFTENQTAFERIASEIDAVPEADKTNELKAIHRIAFQAVADPTMLCDDRNCRRFGDALIGVDGKGFPVIASSNVKEFTVICRALGNSLYQLLPS